MKNSNQYNNTIIRKMSLSEVNERLAKLVVEEKQLHTPKEKPYIDEFVETCKYENELEFDGLFVDLVQPMPLSFAAYEEWNIKR